MLHSFWTGVAGLTRWRGASVTFLSLALGVGVTVAAFSVANGVLLQQLPFPAATRLVMIWTSNASQQISRGDVSGRDLDDWDSRTRSLDGIAVFRASEVIVRTTNGQYERLLSGEVSPELLSLLGVRVLLGRNFVEDDEQPNSPPVVILSHTYWSLHYGADRRVIGRTILGEGVAYTIVGVMPSTFRFFSLTIRDEPLLYFPTRRDEGWRFRVVRIYRALGRLKEGSSLEGASSEMRAIARTLEQLYPRTNAGLTVRLEPLHQEVVGSWGTPLWVVFAAAFLLMLVSCSNTSVLLMLRGIKRREEMAVRSALGATRLHLVCLIVSKTLGLILASSTVGSLVAFAALRAVRSLEIVSQLRVPRIQEVGVDSVVVAFTLAITAIVGILCTLAPVADVARVEPGQTLRREVGQSAFGTLILKSINVIIVMQVALCVMLLDCSFLMLRDLRRLQDLYLGYDYRNLVTMRVSIPTTFPSSQWDSLYLEILQSVRNLPTVGSVATSYPLPCQEFPPWHFRVVEGSIPLPNVQEYVKVQNVTTNYFAVMRASLLRGRLFSTTNGLYETDVTIINRTMAQRFWGNEDPIGRKLVLESIRNPHTIVGVVEDARESPFQAAPPPVAYISRPMNWAYLVVRTKRVPEVVLSGIVGQVRNRAKEVAIDQIAAMESLVFSAGTQPYVQTILVSVFSGLTLVLALVGLYASVSFSVATRVREIGIRLALGATARDVLLLFVLRSLRLTLVGVALGTAGALALTRVLSSVLYGARRGADALVLAFVSLLVTALCVLCGYISARRATLVEAAPLLRCQ